MKNSLKNIKCLMAFEIKNDYSHISIKQQLIHLYPIEDILDNVSIILQ